MDNVTCIWYKFYDYYVEHPVDLFHRHTFSPELSVYTLLRILEEEHWVDYE